MLSKSLGAAGVAFAAVHLIYGRVECAAVGPLQFETSWLQTLVPLIAAVVYPLLSRYVPGWPAIARLLASLLRRPSGQTPARGLLELLQALNELEQSAILNSHADLSQQCAQMRAELIRELKSAGVAQ